MPHFADGSTTKVLFSPEEHEKVIAPSLAKLQSALMSESSGGYTLPVITMECYEKLLQLAGTEAVPSMSVTGDNISKVSQWHLHTYPYSNMSYRPSETT